jgi:hypothetical protein
MWSMAAIGAGKAISESNAGNMTVVGKASVYSRVMSYERVKTEHAGAKNGGGAWMTRSQAKLVSRRKRRRADELAIDESRAALRRDAPADHVDGLAGKAHAMEPGLPSF